MKITGQARIIKSVYLQGASPSPTGRLPNRLRRPLIQVLAVSRCGESGGLVGFGIQAQDEFARVLLAGIPQHRWCKRPEIPSGKSSFPLQAPHVLGVEIRSAIQAQELTPEHADVWFVLDDC